MEEVGEALSEIRTTEPYRSENIRELADSYLEDMKEAGLPIHPFERCVAKKMAEVYQAVFELSMRSETGLQCAIFDHIAGWLADLVERARADALPPNDESGEEESKEGEKK